MDSYPDEVFDVGEVYIHSLASVDHFIFFLLGSLIARLRTFGPNAFLSLCSWHGKRAVGQYLSGHNQSPFVVRHPSFDYRDRDREHRWDIELDSSWMKPILERAEADFRQKIKMTLGNASITDIDELEKIILKWGKDGEICVTTKKNRKAIVERFMIHLTWHPMIFFHMSEEDVKAFDAKQIWDLQVQYMHELCQELGEAWAWEYLWKNWCQVPINIANNVGMLPQNGGYGHSLSVYAFQLFSQTPSSKVCGPNSRETIFGKAADRRWSSLLI